MLVTYLALYGVTLKANINPVICDGQSTDLSYAAQPVLVRFTYIITRSPTL